MDVGKRLGHPDARYFAVTIPIPEREDERVYCKFISSIKSFGPYVCAVWHEMTHIFSLLWHGRWRQRVGFEEPELFENIEWYAFMQRLKASAPAFEKDPVTGELYS